MYTEKSPRVYSQYTLATQGITYTCTCTCTRNCFTRLVALPCNTWIRVSPAELPWYIHAELIITFGHRSNDREFTTRDRLLVSANGKVWPDINALVEMSLSVVPQRWLNDRSRRQRSKNGKKKTICSIRRYHGYDVTSMPKEPTWSLSISQYVGSTKLTYDR